MTNRSQTSPRIVKRPETLRIGDVIRVVKHDGDITRTVEGVIGAREYDNHRHTFYNTLTGALLLAVGDDLKRPSQILLIKPAPDLTAVTLDLPATGPLPGTPVQGIRIRP